MSGSTAALWTLVGVALIAGIVAAIVVGRDALFDRGDMPTPVNAPSPSSSVRQVSRPIYLPPVMLSHDAPEQAYSPDVAHIVTQLHGACSLSECGCKAAAFDALVAAGRVTRPKRESLL
ncbi:hypothetical protein IRT45_35435 [Nocardia sp. BSTN01]|uniref:hypothetical protein n=1 Tax=Nocardia sp. BSTN01 TaxID=2783665 RepID=UPI00188DF26A|nr:hypothetical protein [Nocardia sp. BSTN01]MBF5002412.1 hypothetical protein [Nocardia sp. BSTN01]